MPASPACVRRGHRLRTDRRHVGAQLLPGLGAFDDDAALLAGQPPVRAQRAGRAPAGRRCPRCLPRAMTRPPIATAAWPISSAPIALAAANAAARSLRSAAVGLALVMHAFAGQQIGHDLDARRPPCGPLFSISPTMVFSKASSPLPSAGGDPRQHGQQLEARTQLRQPGPPADAAGQHDMGDALASEKRIEPANAFELERGVVVGFELVEPRPLRRRR